MEGGIDGQLFFVILSRKGVRGDLHDLLRFVRNVSDICSVAKHTSSSFGCAPIIFGLSTCSGGCA